MALIQINNTTGHKDVLFDGPGAHDMIKQQSGTYIIDVIIVICHVDPFVEGIQEFFFQ
jgi:hypothetical protein